MASSKALLALYHLAGPAWRQKCRTSLGFAATSRLRVVVAQGGLSPRAVQARFRRGASGFETMGTWPDIRPVCDKDHMMKTAMTALAVLMLMQTPALAQDRGG